MKCSKCESELLDDSIFCPTCGLKVKSQGKTCPNPECGRTGLSHSALFCPDCGQKIMLIENSKKKEELICNICGRSVNEHDFTNAFVFYKLYFLVAYTSWSYNRLFGCKNCIRNIIDKQTFRVDNVLLGNVFWLLIMLPTNLIAKSKCK